MPFLTEATLRDRLESGKSAVRELQEGGAPVDSSGERDVLAAALERRGLQKGDIEPVTGNVVYVPSLRCYVKNNRNPKGEHEARALAVLGEAVRAHNLPPIISPLIDVHRSPGRVVTFVDDVGISVERWLFKEERDEANFATQLDAVCAQLVLGLYALQRRAAFCHNDLHTKNVSIRFSDEATALAEDVGTFQFPAGSPFVCITDLEFATGVGIEYPNAYAHRERFIQNGAVNNCFDLVRFFTSMFHPRRGVRERRIFSRVSPSLATCKTEMLRHLSPETEWEQFPSHVAAPTPAKILAQKLTFIEQFRVRHVAPFACFFRLAEPSETLQRWFRVRETRSEGKMPCKVRWTRWAAGGAPPADALGAEETVARTARALAEAAGQRVWQLGHKKYRHEGSSREIRAMVVRAQRVCRLMYFVLETEPSAGADPALPSRCARAVDATVAEWSVDQILSGVPAEKWALNKFSPDTALDVMRRSSERNLY